VDVNAPADARLAGVAGNTPVCLAVKIAAREISAAMGAAVDTRALPQRAARRDQLFGIIQILAKAGAKMEIPSGDSTPLQLAVRSKDLETVKVLLANGANPNDGNVLHEAVQMNALGIVLTLVGAGADRKQANHEGKTPIDIAKEKGDANTVRLLSYEPPPRPAGSTP